MSVNLILRLGWIFVFVQAQQIFNNETLANDNASAASKRTHQISTILDRLLTNYDAQIRPNFGGRIEKIFFY